MNRDSLQGRILFVGAIMGIIVVILLWRITQLYFGILISDEGFFVEAAQTQYRDQITVRPPRGEIYDRNGVLLATNSVEYEIGVSPSLIYDAEETAAELAPILDLPYEDVLADIESDLPFVLLRRPAPASMGEGVLNMEDTTGIVVNPLPRRYYPHQTLAAHVLGFVGFDDVGYYGIEGYYNNDLRGRLAVDSQSRIPFDATIGDGWSTGTTVTLTLDTEIQYLAESTLARALSETGATSGTIIVMQPQTGEILAMASVPTFNPNRFYAADAESFENPAVSQVYEPGSTVKAMTMALALETETVTPATTYNDLGVLEVGGAPIYNWDRAAYGVTDMTTILAKSLNIGAATIALDTGTFAFYEGMDRFGFGSRTGVDLQGEVGGIMRQPGSANWFEADIARNSFGQGMATTPLQMVAAFSAIANDGIMMQPHFVRIREEPTGEVTIAEPSAIERVISAETARTLTSMMSSALTVEASPALVEGYTLAGKTGTAQIATPTGYDPDDTIASFIGFGPVDDPQFVVLIKLDRPTSSPWGSQTAAPTFSYFVERLVVLMEIPPDNVRQALTAGP